MNQALRTRISGSLGTFVLSSMGALCAFVLLVLPTAAISMKVMAAGLGGALVVVGALATGNPRLYCLWCLMLTIPLDLSKRFGPVIMKMGGESAFRVEISDPFLLVLIAFLARDIWAGRLPGVRIPKLTYIWLLIALLGCVPVLFGPYRTTAAQEVVRMLKVAVLFLVICNELKTARRILHCSAALTISVVVQSAIGLFERYQGKLLGLSILGETSSETVQQLAVDSVQGIRVFRASALLLHPNLFGVFLAALLPIAIALFLIKTSTGYRLLFLLAIVLGVPALIATLSRSSWVSFAFAAFALLTILGLHNELRQRIIPPVVIACAALIIIGLIYAGPISKRLFESKSGATLARARLNEDAWNLIKSKPVMGWDLNSYALNVPRVMRIEPRKGQRMWGKQFPVVHNIYLLWWAETGIIGMLLHLSVWGGIVWAGIRNLHVPSRLLYVVNAGCLAGFLAFVPDGFFSFSVRMNAIQRVFWVLAGMILAIHYWRLRNPEGETREQPVLPA